MKTERDSGKVKIHFSIAIDAPKEKVWRTMLGEKTYGKWACAFAEGSYFEGNWKQGSTIRFLGPDGNGMVSKIAENRPYEFISIEHLGIINNGKKDTTSEEAKKVGTGL